MLPPSCYVRGENKGPCTSSWEELQPVVRPTQADVGFAWVARKLARDFSGHKKAQAAMDDAPLPVVLGPTFGTSQSVGM